MKLKFFYTITLFFKVLCKNTIKLRAWSIEFVAIKMLFPVAGIIQPKSKGQLHIPELEKMPSGTFGQALGAHMSHYNLEFIPGFEEHDMKHLLLGYPLTVEGEMRLSAFEFGSGNRSFMTLGVFLPALFIAPDLWKCLMTDYKNGRSNRQIRRFHLKSMLTLPLNDVIKQLNVRFMYN